MQSLKISVIVPAYNSQATIVSALDSALSQQYSNVEIIVVDDGSTDDTLEILKTYGSRITLVSQNNAGAAAARNHAARLATGDLLAFLDADDIWHPQKLALQADIFMRNPDIALCTCNVTVRHESDLTSPLPFQQLDAPNTEIISDFSAIFSNPYFGTPTIVIPKQRFEDCKGFDESLVTAEDIDLWLRASYGRSIGKVVGDLVLILRREAGLSATHTSSIFADNLQVIENFCNRNPDFATNNQSLVRRTKARVYEAWASSALCRGENPLARSLLLKSLPLSPSLRSAYLLAKTLIPGPRQNLILPYF